MWIVTVGTKMYEMEFYVEDEETGERRGTFDHEYYAQEMAQELNRERYGNDESCRHIHGEDDKVHS